MTLILRPHHLLCRLGFNGYGYSPEYVAEMSRIAKLFNSGRVKTVIIKPGLDHICRSCPHHEYECSPEKLGIRGRTMAELDHCTLRTLKLKPGHPYPLPEIDERIARLTPEEFQTICRGCEWQRLDLCSQAHEKLRRRLRIEP
ncbi:MAG: DUF1284 domain-containing protein [candidate division FCPU426 bacterium]